MLKYMLMVALLLLLITWSSLAAEKNCYRDSFGKLYCEKSQGVDLSHIGLDGIEAGNRTLESQERIRASQMQREQQLLEMQATRNQQISNNSLNNGGIEISCRLESLSTILCQDATGLTKRYREIDP